MTDTPRTEAISSPETDNRLYLSRMIDHARILERELAVAQKNYQFMVDRATNEKLDGYRELGAKAAAAEERAEKAEAELAEARTTIADLAQVVRDLTAARREHGQG